MNLSSINKRSALRQVSASKPPQRKAANRWQQFLQTPSMYDKLKKHCKQIVPLLDTEVELIDKYFEENTLRKKAFLLQDNKVCNFIAFIAEGTIRHFHVKGGVEKTCDISFDNSWVTDFQSFNSDTLGKMNCCVQLISATFNFCKNTAFGV